MRQLPQPPPADPDLADLLDNPLVEHHQTQFLLLKSFRLKARAGAAFQDVLDEIARWRAAGFEVRFEDTGDGVFLGVQKNLVVDPTSLEPLGPYVAEKPPA